MGSSNVQFQSTTLEKIHVIQRVMEAILGRPVTADEVITGLIDGLSATPEVMKVPVKRAVPVKFQRLSWSKFDFSRFLDGEVHIVSAQEIRESLGLDKRVKSSLVLAKFCGRLSLYALKNGKKLRSHRNDNAINIQLY